MILRNVVWGEKYLVWEGPLTLYSAKSKYEFKCPTKNLLTNSLFSKLNVTEEVTDDDKTLNPFTGVIFQSKPETEEGLKVEKAAAAAGTHDQVNYGTPMYQVRGIVGKVPRDFFLPCSGLSLHIRLLGWTRMILTRIMRANFMSAPRSL